MLKIAICDDDLKFTGELETLVMKECQRSSTRCEQTYSQTVRIS